MYLGVSRVPPPTPLAPLPLLLPIRPHSLTPLAPPPLALLPSAPLAPIEKLA